MDLTDPAGLVGTWRLEREVEDHRTCERHRITGTLTLTAAGDDRIRWAERGVWHRDTGDVEVRRDLWVVRREDDDWWVRFDDDRDFHPWRPGDLVVHPCAPDTYRGLVSGTTQAWRVAWDVTGPAKDYRMVTDLVPA